MTKLYIQLLNQKMELVQSISLSYGKEKSIVLTIRFIKLFTAASAPSKLIILDYSKNEGGEIEVLKKRHQKSLPCYL